MGTCNVSASREWDRHSRSVGRSIDWSVDACVPIDHASVRFTQAIPCTVSESSQ